MTVHVHVYMYNAIMLKDMKQGNKYIIIVPDTSGDEHHVPCPPAQISGQSTIS